MSDRADDAALAARDLRSGAIPSGNGSAVESDRARAMTRKNVLQAIGALAGLVIACA